MLSNKKYLRKISSRITTDHLTHEIKKSKLFLIRLPNLEKSEINLPMSNFTRSKIFEICKFVNYSSSIRVIGKTLIFLGPLYLLPYVFQAVHSNYTFQSLIAIRLKKTELSKKFLPNEHLGAMIFSTRSKGALNDVKKPYQYCKCCKDTVKDYGGKKHLLEKDGTRISDVWTDITMEKDEEFSDEVLDRIYHFTRKGKNDKINFLSLNLNIKKWNLPPLERKIIKKIIPETNLVRKRRLKLKTNHIFNTDVFDGFKKIPDNSVDLALVDPPYNLSIKYGKFSDQMNDLQYLKWTKKWIDEISRTLKKGGLLTLVNIPRWSLELFPYLQQKLTFQGWIVWDAFSFPHTPIIPAHYPILCFSKGSKMKLKLKQKLELKKENCDILNPLNYGYCIRSRCLNIRTLKMSQDRKILTNLWSDAHRIRHNSFRYSHPTLMPQKLAKRLVLLFSKPNDLVLDCFNGVGTTTLVAKSSSRKYLGIEKNPLYYKTSIKRHDSLKKGEDPFARLPSKSTSTEKGYPEIKYQMHVMKTELQIEVKKVAKKLGHCPSKTELRKYGKYPMKYYHDNFRDWAEITVATRRTGLKT